MAAAVVKQEWHPSPSPSHSSSATDPTIIPPRPPRFRPPPSHTITNADIAHSATWAAPSSTESFIRSEGPPPTQSRPPPSRVPQTVRTAEDSEPVFLELRNRTMAPPPINGVNGHVVNSQSDSFFDGSFRDIGAKLKACNDTLGELQQLGVEHIVSLPSLVLVGDQSAGKSSLMSGLAGLNLPRSEGVCTRCPIHIRVSRHDEWSCRVSLQLDYSFQPPEHRFITRDDVTPNNPFPPWVPQNREVKDFKTIYDSNKDDIETVLRWAQVAILNHGQNPDHFVPGTGHIARTRDLTEAAEDTAAKFSPNTVALEIKGPDLPDLSFYDLPGIFRNSAQEEDEYLVQVVENLARQHISRADALIIWAVPMNADPETSSTLSIIREVNAKQRTIGVMTKADLLPVEGTHSQWLAMLRGERHAIGHGYFITSRPTDQALEDQQRWEEALFGDGGHEKWPAEFLQFQGRCGVERLKAALSEKLGEAFATNLPKIKTKVQSSLRDVQKKLSNLPELPDNVEYEVRKSLRDFTTIVKDKLRGNEFSSEFNQLSNGFQKCLVETKPKFTLRDASDSVIEISDDDNDSTASTPTNRKRSFMQEQLSTASKRSRPNGGPGSRNGNGSLPVTPAHNNNVKREESVVPIPMATPRLTSQTPRKSRLPPPFDQFQSLGSGFRTIGQIRDDIKFKTKPGTAGIVPEEVYRDLCKESVAHWNRPMDAFLKATTLLLHRIINAALEDAFSKMKRRLVFKQAKSNMKLFLDEYRDSATTFLREIYEMESYQLYTMNLESLDEYRKVESRLMSRYRHYMRWRAFTGAEGPPFKDWAGMTPEERKAEENSLPAQTAKLGPDSFEEEIKVAAYVRGYYRLAALRFSDTASLSIISRMFPRIVDNLDCYLEDKLGLIGEGASAACRSLMDEDAATATRRESLKVMADKLRKAEASIQELEMEAGDAEPMPLPQYQAPTAESVADSAMDEF